MPIVEDSTDPQSTKRLNKNLILVSTHIFKLIIVIEYSPRLYFSLNIFSKDIYGISFLFFTNNVLEIIIKNTNKYTVLRKAQIRKLFS